MRRNSSMVEELLHSFCCFERNSLFATGCVKGCSKHVSSGVAAEKYCSLTPCRFQLFSGLRLPQNEAVRKFGENSEQKTGQYSGRKFENFGKLSFCNFSDLNLWTLIGQRVLTVPVSRLELRTLFPLTAFKNARNPKFVQNLSQRLFWGVPVRGTEIWKNLSKIWKTVIFGQFLTNFSKFQSPWLEPPKTIAGTNFGQI